jgi:aldehyde dehydrogenase (NAD+)
MADRNTLRFYIDGAWVDPERPRTQQVINPATEQPAGEVSLGSAADVDRAVAAARAAFVSYSQTTPAQRIEMFESIIAAYRKRIDEVAALVTAEMGAPMGFAKTFHATAPVSQFQQMIDILKTYEFGKLQGSTLIQREPIGVCGLITPWNVPVATLVNKMAAALAAGCTVVAKPSELAPLSPIVLAEALHEAGVPHGVFNLVNGDGATVGERIASHPDVDMISFTGSTRAGVLVAQAAAPTVKRVQQELGGKSANIVLPDADIEKVVAAGLQRCYVGGGQSCQAPTRMLVHSSQQERAMAAAKAAAEAYVVGDPLDPRTTMGPVANRAQFDKIQRLIAAGIAEGATLVTGGPGRPGGLTRGYFVRPTVFANVGRKFQIAQEEIFGPVLSILPYRSEEEAISIANDTMYGLAGWVYSADLDHARRVALKMRTGRVYLNGAPPDPYAPFGGYKRSGNGREGGIFGLEEYLEVKALIGSAVAPAA